MVLRVVLGGFVAAHGIQKLTYWWGGTGLTGSTQEFRDDGFLGGVWTALLAGLTQVGAGVLLIGGLLTPAAATGVIGVMTVATTVKLRSGFWSQDGGFEYPLFLAALGVVVAWTGPGSWSVDEIVGLTAYWIPAVSLAATVGGIGAALLLRLALHRDHLENHPAGGAA
nr:DoxX family protein [Nocardioides sp. KC13]